MKRKFGSRLLGPLSIVAGTAALIALTWFNTVSATHTQRIEAEARVGTNVANQALVFQDQLQRKLQEMDQALRILAHAWETDPGHFNLLAWRDQLVLLNDPGIDISVADESGVVRHATLSESVGINLGDRDYFRASKRSSDEDRMFVGPPTTEPRTQQWRLDLARRLRHPDGTFAGVIVAGLPISALGSFYRMANIGSHGIIAVVGLEQGHVRMAVGPGPINRGANIADTPMYKAMRAEPDGVWIGRSALDDVERFHGFQVLADRNLAIAVGVERAEAMAATEEWVMAAYVFAARITVLLLAMAGFLLNDLHAANRREKALAHDRAVLAATNTQLKLAKTLADDKTAQLEATLVGMTDGVAMVDGRLRLVEWNPRFPGLSGVPSSILRVGLPMEDMLRAQAASGQFGPVDVEEEVARRMAVIRSGNYPATKERTRSDGTVLELRRNSLPDGGFVTLFTDITARKQTEATLREAGAMAESAKQAMSRFVAIVSHEIRAPLNALLNSLILLAESRLAPAQQALVDMCRRSGDALLALVNDILEMSKKEAGQLVLRPSVFGLRQLIESTLQIFGAPATERGIVLRLSMADDVPDELYADPGRLRQVLINLLSNAVKFADEGEVRVTAKTQLAGGSTQLRLTVRDRGPIIPENDRSRLFQPFSRIEQAGAEGPAGTGLGLAICRHLVTMMGGEIGCDVWTMVGREAGNEFWIVLPVTAPPSWADAMPAQADAHPKQRLPRTRILLVEDIAANQLVTAMQLRREGHLVDIAGNGREAINAVASRPYDLVFMDVFMPGMSGLDATTRIRAMAGPAAVVPIVALTASAGPEDQAICGAAGMNGMLSKPAALTALLDAMARHVWPHRPNQITLAAVTPPQPAAHSRILSATRLDELRTALPADTLESLIEECLADLSQRRASLQQSLQRNATEQALADAHAMAGMAAEYGMAALENRVRALMHLLRKETASAAGIAGELETDILHAGTALRGALLAEVA